MERQLGAAVTGCFFSAPPILVHCILSQGRGNFQMLRFPVLEPLHVATPMIAQNAIYGATQEK